MPKYILLLQEIGGDTETTQGWHVSEEDALTMRKNWRPPDGEYVETKEQRQERAKHEHGVTFLNFEEETDG